jgi:chromosome partitioning protein
VLKTAAEEGADIVIIDTAPHSESTALAAARAADYILIPCRPAILDLRAINTTIDLARLAKTPACVVLNAVPPRGSLPEEAAEAIAGYEISVASTHIRQRMAFVHALTLGQVAQEYEPRGKAAEEIKELYMYICKHVKI